VQSPLVATQYAGQVAVQSEDGPALDLPHGPRLAAEVLCGRLQSLAEQNPPVATNYAKQVAVPSEDAAVLDLQHDPRPAAEVLSAWPRYLSPCFRRSVK
jgi:hypothetical protein